MTIQTYSQVIFDADGVLVDSRAEAWRAAEDIVSIFESGVRVDSVESHQKYFGRDAQCGLVGEEASPVLRSMHRLIMRHRAHRLKTFPNVIEVARQLIVPALVVTAAYAEGIQVALANDITVFSTVVGREQGTKVELLDSLRQSSDVIYITDSRRDIAICHLLSIPVVAVTWGYSSSQCLADANPDFLVRRPLELEALLSSFNLTRRASK